MTCGDRVDTAILGRSHLLGAVYTSSFAVVMQQDLEWATADHPGRSLTICIESQSLLKAIEYRTSVTHHLRSVLDIRSALTTLL